jgi:hypothetical protein
MNFSHHWVLLTMLACVSPAAAQSPPLESPAPGRSVAPS